MQFTQIQFWLIFFILLKMNDLCVERRFFVSVVSLINEATPKPPQNYKQLFN